MATRLVYLDSNVLIAAFETADPFGRPARRLLEAIERGELTAVTSEITLSEVLVRPLRDGDGAMAEVYRQVVSTGEGLLVHPVDRPILERAASLRASLRGLKLPDALHLATARSTGCPYILSGDERIPSEPACRRIDLTGPAVDSFLENRTS